MRWPWQRDRDVPPVADPGAAAASARPGPAAAGSGGTESTSGWAFLPPMQRTVAPVELTSAPTTFVDDLPTRSPLRFTGAMSHVVDVRAPSGVVDGGAPPTVQRSADVDLTLLPPAPRPATAQRRTAGALVGLDSAPAGTPRLRAVPVGPPVPADLPSATAADPGDAVPVAAPSAPVAAVDLSLADGPRSHPEPTVARSAVAPSTVAPSTGGSAGDAGVATFAADGSWSDSDATSVPIGSVPPTPAAPPVGPGPDLARPSSAPGGPPVQRRVGLGAPLTGSLDTAPPSDDRRARPSSPPADLTVARPVVRPAAPGDGSPRADVPTRADVDRSTPGPGVPVGPVGSGRSPDLGAAAGPGRAPGAGGAGVDLAVVTAPAPLRLQATRSADGPATDAATTTATATDSAPTSAPLRDGPLLSGARAPVSVASAVAPTLLGGQVQRRAVALRRVAFETPDAVVARTPTATVSTRALGARTSAHLTSTAPTRDAARTVGPEAGTVGPGPAPAGAGTAPTGSPTGGSDAATTGSPTADAGTATVAAASFAVVQRVTSTGSDTPTDGVAAPVDGPGDATAASESEGAARGDDPGSGPGDGRDRGWDGVPGAGGTDGAAVPLDATTAWSPGAAVPALDLRAPSSAAGPPGAAVPAQDRPSTASEPGSSAATVTSWPRTAPSPTDPPARTGAGPVVTVSRSTGPATVPRTTGTFTVPPSTGPVAVARSTGPVAVARSTDPVAVSRPGTLWAARSSAGGHRAPASTTPLPLAPAAGAPPTGTPAAAAGPSVLLDPSPTTTPPTVRPAASGALPLVAQRRTDATAATAATDEPATPPVPLPDPPVQRTGEVSAPPPPVASTDAAAATGAAAAATGAAGGASPFAAASPADLDELARRLMTPLLRRVRGQLLVDRERRGTRTDR